MQYLTGHPFRLPSRLIVFRYKFWNMAATTVAMIAIFFAVITGILVIAFEFCERKVNT
jgi:hypothetical protein